MNVSVSSANEIQADFRSSSCDIADFNDIIDQEDSPRFEISDNNDEYSDKEDLDEEEIENFCNLSDINLPDFPVKLEDITESSFQVIIIDEILRLLKNFLFVGISVKQEKN